MKKRRSVSLIILENQQVLCKFKVLHLWSLRAALLSSHFPSTTLRLRCKSKSQTLKELCHTVVCLTALLKLWQERVSLVSGQAFQLTTSVLVLTLSSSCSHPKFTASSSVLANEINHEVQFKHIV